MPSDWNPSRRRFFSAAIAGTIFNSRSFADPPSQGNATLAEFNVHSDGDLMFVPLTISGKEYPVILDTGAQGTVFDDSLAPLLGAESPNEAVVNGEATAKVHWRPQMRLGGMDVYMLDSPRVYRMDLKRLREASGDDFYGILGFDWIKSQILQIDFRRGRLQVLRDAPSAKSSAIPIEINDNRPLVRATFPELGEVRLLLDTGCGGGIAVSMQSFDALKKAKALNRVSSTSIGVMSVTGGTYGVEQGFVTDIQIGPHRILDAAVYTPIRRPSEEPKPGSEGKLGMEVLSAFNVSFDFPNKRMYLDDFRGLEESSSTGFSGLACVRRGGRTIVDHSDSRGPWRKAGVMDGDEIVSIDGIEASKTRHYVIKRMLRRVGKRMTLRIKRNGQVHEFTAMIPAG